MRAKQICIIAGAAALFGASGCESVPGLGGGGGASGAPLRLETKPEGAYVVALVGGRETPLCQATPCDLRINGPIEVEVRALTHSPARFKLDVERGGLGQAQAIRASGGVTANVKPGGLLRLSLIRDPDAPVAAPTSRLEDGAMELPPLQ